MSNDNKPVVSTPERQRIAANDVYEVRYAAQLTGRTMAEVRAAIKDVGPDRERVMARLREKRRALRSFG